MILASLRSRLILVPSAILLVGLAAIVAFNFHRAQLRVHTETSSGMRLARILVNAGFLNLRTAPDPAAAWTEFERGLPTIRHVEFVVLPPASLVPFGGVPIVKENRRAVPLWFTRMFDVPAQAENFPVVVNGRTEGRVVIVSNPLDEVAEIWDELKFLAALLFVLAAVIVALLVWSANLALRPIRDLTAAFDRLEHGRFDQLVPPIRLTELRRIGEQFDSLARSLQRVTADNHRLIDKLISVQEAERKEVARELHDEFGPSLFGIRADISCILRWSKTGEPRFRDIEERARSIGELVDGIQRINYRMLDRLRPLVLDQMGLVPALRQLVMACQDRYPDIAWSLDLPAEIALPDEAASLTLYRVVQECLTNVVRHAEARSVEVALQREPGRSDGGITVSVRDDGRGFPPDLRFGFGLLGIAERIRARHGRLQVGSGPTGGALVEAFLPCEPAMAQA
jgi:two-component system sensor histidine kinase UhpB